MAFKKRDINYRSRKTERMRRIRANRSEEKKAFYREKNRLTAARLRAAETAEQRAARLEHMRLRSRQRYYAAKKKKAELRAQQALSTASNLPRSQQNKHNKRKVVQKRQRKTCDGRQKGFHAQQSPDFNRLEFRFNPDEEYSLSQHVTIGTVSKVNPHNSAVEFNAETQEMYCAARKIKLEEPEREAADQRETLSRAEQSPDYNRFAIQCNSADGYNLSQHNAEAQGMSCTSVKIKLEEPERETADQRETLSRAEQSPDYNRFAIQCHSANGYNLSQHNTEAQGMSCSSVKIKLEEPERETAD